MQLRISDRNLELPLDVRRAIERRLRLVIGRHAAGIARLHLTLSRSRSPTEAETSRCRIRVDLRQGTTLTVEDAAADPSAAATAAAWRLQRRLRQRLGTREVA